MCLSLITPAFAYVGTELVLNSNSIIIENTTYIQNDGFIPFHIWISIVSIGIIFLVLSLLFKRGEIISAIIATFLFGLAAYVSLVIVLPEDIAVYLISNQTESGGVLIIEAISLVYPTMYNIGSIWLAIAMVGMMFISVLKAVMGIADMALRGGEEAENTIGSGEKRKIETVNAPGIRDIARKRFGRK